MRPLALVGRTQSEEGVLSQQPALGNSAREVAAQTAATTPAENVCSLLVTVLAHLSRSRKSV